MIDGYGLERQVVLVGSKENPYPYMKNADFWCTHHMWNRNV